MLIIVMDTDSLAKRCIPAQHPCKQIDKCQRHCVSSTNQQEGMRGCHDNGRQEKKIKSPAENIVHCIDILKNPRNQITTDFIYENHNAKKDYEAGHNKDLKSICRNFDNILD
mmetsp:Transcript_22056/g.49815  ORF Transcript_22056/g.49815 Transcript_22056/m.49815 type:complete len:112 (+) Transcript_22056:178-513(+)